MLEGFRPWINSMYLGPMSDSPYSHEWVELMREGWEKPIKASPVKLAPEMNVADLWWKPLISD